MKLFAAVLLAAASMLVLGVGFTAVSTEVSAQSRRNNFPNAGYCPNGKPVRDLKNCPKSSKQ